MVKTSHMFWLNLVFAVLNIALWTINGSPINLLVGIFNTIMAMLIWTGVLKW